MVDISTNKALESKTIPTNRLPDEKIAIIKGAMEATTRRVAPEWVQPSGETRHPEALAEELKKQREKMEESIGAADMTEACVGYKHPALGTMTKLDWVYFNIYHTGRHGRQLQRLLKGTDV